MGFRRERHPGEPRRLSVAIAGGALQGLEMTYLARKAGFETLLLDRRSDAPATGICDRFHPIDLTDQEALSGALGSVDLVLPATENGPALQSLVEWCDANRVPLAFDLGAYAISSSKRTSDALFRELGLPTPAPWPDCAFPVLAKPESGSGSEQVEVFPDLETLRARFDSTGPSSRILQEYLTGPAYSIEVLGRPGNYAPLQTTELEMDRGFDCKRVLAPSSLPHHLASLFGKMAVTLAEAIGLTGIMDVEAILHEDRLRLLEIDARFPSQTPIAVYHSTGINMVERLARIFTRPDDNGADSVPSRPEQGSILEHVRVRDGELAVCGEHVMAEAGPLHIETDFFGADEALTSHAPGRHDWVATLMVKGSDLQDARERRDQVIGEIRARFGLHGYRDDYPEEPARRVR